MEHYHILSFLLVRGLTIILVVGGLGVEDNRMASAKTRPYSKRFLFVGFGQRGSLLLKTEKA
jgi:hypothetical protein